MKEVLFYLILGLASVTYFVGLSSINKEGRKGKIDRLYFMSTMCSAGWGLFMGLVLMQTDESIAALFRAIGMIHIFGLLITFTNMMVYWSNIRGKVKKWSSGFAWIGVLLYPFVIQQGNVEFEMTVYGMSYRIRPGIWSVAYVVFCAAVAVNLML